MKIALLTPTFSWFSGIDRVVYDQARQLLSKGNQVEIFAFASDMEPPAGAGLHIFGMPKSLLCQRIYRLLLPFLFWNIARLASQLSGFEVIYSHQYPMNWLAYLARNRYGTRYIYYDYGIAPPEAFDSVIERAYMYIFTRLSNWTARKSDGVISISFYLKKEFERATGLASEVVYPRIDTQRFHTGIDALPIRQKYGLGKSPLVLYVGRISPHKGIHLLIKAFLEVGRDIPGARLLIVGKHTFDSYSRELKSMSDQSIIFAGYVPEADMPQYYAACDVYATATLWEGFNLPLTEAQAFGKPVVAFNLGPHPEVVIAGKTGYLSPPEDIHALAESMRALLSNDAEREKMGRDAAEFVKEKFG